MNDVAITLAERINAAHQAAHDTARSAIEHAIECGRLLAEAKVQIGHGGWLPWIEANLNFGPRQAQKYLRLAEKAPELPNANSNSHLTLDDALVLLAAPKPKQQEPEPGSWEWCDAQLKGPFSGWDVIGSDAAWLQTKLLYHAGLSPVADVCLQAQIEHELPILRLVPADELYEAQLLLEQIASGEREPPFDHKSLNLHGVFRLWSALKDMAQRAAAMLAAEFEYRGTIDDDRYAREFDTIKARWMGRLRLVEQYLAEQRAGLEAQKAG